MLKIKRLKLLKAWHVGIAGFIGLAVQASASELSAPQVEPGPEIITGQAKQSVSRAARQSALEAQVLATSPILDSLKPLAGELYPRRKNRRQARHRLDQDRDGYVSKNELDLEHQTKTAAFRLADINRDGKLDVAELRRYQALTQPRRRN